MTIEQIERKLQRMTDSADAALMNGRSSQAEYDARMKEINKWADVAFALVSTGHVKEFDSLCDLLSHIEKQS